MAEHVRRPSHSSTIRLPPLQRLLGSGVRARIQAVKAPETTKLAASTRTAYGAVASAIRPPAAPGPASCAPEDVMFSFELPSISVSRSTISGRYDWYATSKKTVWMPTRKPTT